MRWLVWMSATVALGCAAHEIPPTVSIAPAPTLTPPAPPPEPEPPKVPANYMRMSLAGVLPQPGDAAAVALLDPSGTTILPIYVGGTEAVSIQLRAKRAKYARPLTHDLFDAMLHEVGGVVVRAQIDKLQDGVFFGTLVVELRHRYVELDSRPSDAIALAIGADAPIYCAADVLTQAGVPRERLEASPAPSGSGGSGGSGGGTP